MRADGAADVALDTLVLQNRRSKGFRRAFRELEQAFKEPLSGV